jgi:pyruvate/2-oxoglutarate/acetoin dehydrogenase E1 component
VKKMPIVNSIVAAMAGEMRRDERVIYLATNPPAELTDEFGPLRVRRTPIAESAMTGMAVGAAASGLRPIVGLSNVAFMFVAFDQIINQTARARYMFGCQRDFPIVIVGHFLNGTRSAAQHSQTGYAYFAHAAGLKVAAPSNAADAHGLMSAAVRDNNPVVYLYAERLNRIEEEVPDDVVPVPLGVARNLHHGVDLTIVGVGAMARVALAAAELLTAEGISADVIDPRTLVPLDLAAIAESVGRTGRLVIVDESFPVCSIASEIAARIAGDDQCLRALRGPIRRVCTAPVPVPFSGYLEDAVMPGVGDVIEAARELVAMRA